MDAQLRFQVQLRDLACLFREKSKLQEQRVAELEARANRLDERVEQLEMLFENLFENWI